MAGTPDPIADKTADTPSLPLYLAGLVITLCGTVAANEALPTTDYGWMGRTVLLAGLGFLFSYGSRRLGIPAKQIDFGFAALIVLLLAAFTTGQLAWEQFLPLGADNPNLRLLAGLASLATLWAWALRNDNRVMGTTVPAMAALGLAATVDLNDPVLACFALFILTVIFLLIHQNYLQNRARAALADRGLADRRLLGAQFAQAGLCALAVLLAGLVVIVPAQAVFARLSLAQAIRHLAAIGQQHAPPGGNAGLRFSDDDNLPIGTGDAWSASAEVVMHVSPSDGQEHYWRGRTYDTYTGDGWQSSLENQTQTVVEGVPDASNGTRLIYKMPPDLMPGDPAANDAPSLTATFRVVGDTNQFYYAASPRQVLLDTSVARDGRTPRLCRDGRLDLADRSAVRFAYAIASSPAPDPTRPEVQDRLRGAGTDYSAEIKRLYLSQTDNGITQPQDTAFYKQALAEALQSLPPERRDPLDEAVAIRAWVSNRCIYSLAVPPIPPDADHVHAFLGDTRRGYCDMFASAMAILCRTAGIPARLATGFAPGDPDADGFNLRGEDKHAWTEVYFPGAGWAAFDPTSGSRSDGSVPTAKGNRSGSWFSRLRFLLGSGWEFVWPLLAVILLILAYVLKTEVYDRWRARRAPVGPVAAVGAANRTDLGRQYARMTRALARLGLPRRPSETPDEYAARVAPLLAAQERELGLPLSAAPVAALTAAFTQACYGGLAVASREGADAKGWKPALTQFEGAARQAQWRRFWRRKSYPVSLEARHPSLGGKGFG